MATLFLVGFVEMVILSCWTKVVTENKVLASGVVTIFNIIIWYYVLERIISDLNNITLVSMYALGCALGTMVATYYYQGGPKRAKRRAAKKALTTTSSDAVKNYGNT